MVNGSVRDPCFRRDDPSSGESFVNNQKTFPKEYVITEADEGGYQESPTSVTVHSNKPLVNGSVRDPLSAGQASCFRRDDPSSGESFVNKLQTFPKEYVIPEADEGGNQESLTSVTVHSNKPLVNGSVRDPCFRRDDPSSGESFVNNQKTFPKEYVITEADEGGYQESLTSVTVHSNKPLVNGSVRDPCFRRDDPSSGESFVNNQKTSPKEYVITEADEVSSCVAHIRNLLPQLPLISFKALCTHLPDRVAVTSPYFMTRINLPEELRHN
ncbi:MAG: hypothetical protein H6548_11600 [Chitinophagales bacterium]|nr:hypothetical protein [Chitinophagales bacterium]